MKKVELKADAPVVLIVDDDTDASRAVVRLLQRHQYQLITAASGVEALDILAKRTVDVLVLDVMMPGMTGLDVCERLRSMRRFADLPVILLTGCDDFETRRAGMRLGVSEFLCKPFPHHDLIDRIEAQLRVRNLSKALDSVDGTL
jgi:DNA-binding response OmpR family regulator